MLYVGDVSTDLSVWHLNSALFDEGKRAMKVAMSAFLEGAQQPGQQNVLHQAKPVQVIP